MHSLTRPALGDALGYPLIDLAAHERDGAITD
jgi:hypothetical protein